MGSRLSVRERGIGRLACLMILPFAVLLLLALHGASPALAKWPSPTEPIRRPLAPAATMSHQGLAANATVPSWAAGKSIYFFASPGAGFSFGGLSEPGFKGAGEVKRNLGRRCEEGYCPEPPLLYHEGKGVQHSPSVHVIFWGKNWEKTPGSELRTQLLKLYEGISGSTWQGILTQYFDSAGRVSSTISVSSYIDTSVAAPSSVNDHALREEVASAVKAKSWTRESSSQFVVIPAPGATYTAEGTFTANTTKGSSTLKSVSSFANVAPGERIEGPGIPEVAEVISINTTEKTATLNKEATATGTGVTIATEGFAHGFCGYHGVDGSGSSYTFVAYPGEEPFKKECISFDPKENADNVTSMIASHEYAESVTDPQVEPLANAEWYTSNYYELADICASGDDEITEGSLKGSFVQGLWDDHQSACSLSDKEPPHVYAVTEPAIGLKTHEATLKGTVNPENTETKYYFEYGPTASYGTKTAEVSAGSGLSNKEAKQTITGLTLEGTYHYRLVATNSTGTTDGEDHTVTLSRWVTQTTPHPTESIASALSDISCTSSTSCTAAGLNDVGGYRSLAEHWNGTEWAIQTVPQPKAEFSYLGSISCGSATACVALGIYGYPDTWFTESWSGTEWTIHSIVTPVGGKEAFLSSVSCWSATGCIAVGGFVNSGGVSQGLAELWNGTEWSLQTVPNPSGAKSSGLSGVSCFSSTGCTAVGGYTSSTGATGTLAERWNGKEWTIQTSPNPVKAERIYLTDVSCPSASACTAVGFAFGEKGGLKEPLVEHWNGTEWTIQATPTPPGLKGANELSAVSCPSATTCTAVGSYYITAPSEIPQKSVTLSELWNGAEWTVQLPQSTENALNELGGVSCVSTAPETCETVGSYQPDRGAETMLAESRVAIPPFGETKPATSLTETGATLNGAVNPEGYETKYYFEYGLEAKYESRTAEASAGAGTAKLEESKAVTGLKPSTTYTVRLVASNSGATGVKGSEVKFSTTGKPTVETRPATNVGETGATLNGTVNPRGVETKYYFEYGTTEAYGLKTAEVSAGKGTTTLEESKAITGLAVSTTYYFRIVATNGEGTSDGSPESFKTITKPHVETKLATSVSETAATLNGTVNPEGGETKYDFEYGTSESYGSKTAEASAGAGTSNVEVSKAVSALSPNTLYHFRAVATNNAGTVDGADQAFATPPWSWSATATPPVPSEALNSSLKHVSCSSAASCIAVGDWSPNGNAIERPLADGWNGTEWKLQTAQIPSETENSKLYGVSCSSSTACMAVGFYQNSSSGTYFSLSETWNGTEWKIQPTAEPTGTLGSLLLGVSCTSSTACTAVGYYENSSGVEVPLAERWNGTAWSVQATPAPTGAKSSYPYEVSCTSSTACTMVGYYHNSSSVDLPFAESWNGTEWVVQTVPSPTGAEYVWLYDVSCTSSTACTAVGDYRSNPETWLMLAEHWNGSAWSVATTASPSGSKSSYLTGVSCTTATACTAVGDYENSSKQRVTLAEAWNGTEWQIQTTRNNEKGEGGLASVSCTFAVRCMALGGPTQIEN